MNIYSFFKKLCIIFFLLPLLFACSGDVDTYPGNPSPNISVSDSTYDFGGIVLDNASDKTFVIKNTGNEPLSIGTISYPIDPFFILADTCSNKTLGVNKTCSVITRFSPIIQAVFADAVAIPSNDPSGTVTIGLSGEGHGLNVWINKIETAVCEVTLDVTVTSPLLDCILDSLTEDKFELYENGELIAGIDVFQNLVPSPVSVVLAIDWSGSVIGVIETIKAAANAFVDSLDPTFDEAAACKFGGEIEFDPAEPDPLFYPDPVDGWTPLTTYIDSYFDGSGGTDLYDAVYESIDRAVLGGKDKKVVIVLSDGVNVNSGDLTPDRTLAAVIEHATTAAIPVFTIYYVDTYGKPEVMEQLAEETGGQHYNGTVDLTDVYQQIFDLLYSQYRITYTSTICDGDVPLEVLADYSGFYGEDSGRITFTSP
jgi:VWFA-related protein